MAPRPGAFGAWIGAGPRPPLWHLPAGLVLVLALWAGWTALVTAAFPGPGLPGDAARSPAGVALVLASLAGLWPAVAAAAWLLGEGAPARLLAAPGRPALAGAGGGILLGLGVALASGLVAILVAGPPRHGGIAPVTWLVWALPLAGLVLLQASGEEVLFRGWMLRLLARRARRPIVWAGLPALAFAALHVQPGPLGLVPAATAGLVGLAAAVLVRRAGGPAPAMGLHAGLNLPALLVAGPDGPLAGALLLRWPPSAGPALLWTGFATAAVLLAVLLAAPPGRGPPRRPV